MKTKARIWLAAALSISLLFVSAQTSYANQSFVDIICEPSGITATADGGYLISDLYNKVIWKVTNGTCTPIAGKTTSGDLYGEPYGGYKDGSIQDSYFQNPWAIVPFMDGYAVSDSKNNVVRLLRDTSTKTAVASVQAGYLDGNGTGAVFSNPTGLAYDETGNLYVADTNNNCIRKVFTSGRVTTFATDLASPTGLFYQGGSLYVAESGLHRIVKITEGEKTVIAGNGTDDFVDGTCEMAAFSSPQGITVSDDGAIYVSDTGNSAIRKIDNGAVTTLLQNDGSSLNTYPVSPRGIMIQGDNLLICDIFSGMLYAVPR